MLYIRFLYALFILALTPVHSINYFSYIRERIRSSFSWFNYLFSWKQTKQNNRAKNPQVATRSSSAQTSSKSRFFGPYRVSIVLPESIELIIYTHDILTKDEKIRSQDDYNAIVNAANVDLKPSEGVSERIFDAAGAIELQKGCAALAPCLPGDAEITDSYNLKNKDIAWIIHAVAPQCEKDKQYNAQEIAEQNRLLISAYTKSLDLALNSQRNITGIAFPFLGGGSFHFPVERAAACALKAFNDWGQKNQKAQLRKIYITLFEVSNEQKTQEGKVAEQYNAFQKFILYSQGGHDASNSINLHEVDKVLSTGI